MNFHGTCECSLVPYKEDGVIIHYDVISMDVHVGSLRLCSVPKHGGAGWVVEWIFSPATPHIGVTLEYMDKIRQCLVLRLTTSSDRFTNK